MVAISAGSRQALALRSDHTVVAWGSGVAAGLDGTPPASWSDVVAISSGSGNSLGLRSDGTVLAYGIWGEAGPPHATNVAAVSASTIDLFLHRDATISAYPVSLAGLPTDSGYQAVSAGNDYGLAIEEPEAPEPAGPVLGSDVVQPSVDSNPPGTAEAFTYTASLDASADTFHLYLDPDNEAKLVIVGVYDDNGGEPGRLLSTGRSRTLVGGEWNSIPLATPVRVEAGEHYWLTLLGPKYYRPIRFRDLPNGTGEAAKISAQNNLTAYCGLPQHWSTGADFTNSPASAYLS